MSRGGHVLAYAGCHGDRSVRIGSPPSYRTPALPLPSSTHPLTDSRLFHRNEWEPPDKKVDTRKYRAEPRSIFEYEPGKSSVLKLERTVRSPLTLSLHPSLSLFLGLSLSACCVSWLAPAPPPRFPSARTHSTAVSKLAVRHLPLSEGLGCAASLAFPCHIPKPVSHCRDRWSPSSFFPPFPSAEEGRISFQG